MNEKNNILNLLIEGENNRYEIILNELKDNYPRKEFNEVKEYLDDFLNRNPVNRFILLPGLQGVGKTTILYQIYDYLINNKHVNLNQILYLSGDVINDLSELNILEIVEYYVKKIYNKTLLSLDQQLVVLIDEAQYDKKWSLHGKIIFDKTDKIFMVYTGSFALEIDMNADAARRLLNIPIYPLNYRQYLFLKYNINLTENNTLKDLIFTGNVEKALEIEHTINTKIFNCSEVPVNEWNDYLKYGGFPDTFNQKNKLNICKKLNTNVDRIIEKDLNSIKNISVSSKTYAARLVRFLALQKPGEISKNKLADILDCSNGTVQNILTNLEKTQLIFHTEPLSSASKRVRKSWKYYFATSSLRHNLAKNYGNTYRDISAYYGVLAENLVASTLHTLSKNGSFDLYYDANKEGVDFLIQTGLFEIIPIEVGYGNKTKRKIKKAISKYKANYGIIVSDTTENIEKEDNIIYMPIKTFSLI